MMGSGPLDYFNETFGKLAASNTKGKMEKNFYKSLNKIEISKDISENSKQRQSLRACGAFKSPDIILESDSIEFAEDLDGLAKRLVTRIKEVVGDFLDRHTVAEYAIENAENIFNGDTLQRIVLVDMGEYERAKEIAKEAVRNDDDGGFENEGRSFFQWLLHYLRKRKRQNFFSNLWG